MKHKTPDVEPVLQAALKLTGFVPCEFGPSTDPCEKCNAVNRQLYFGNRDYWDSREGDYWCESCVVAVYDANRKQTEHDQ